MQVKKAYRQLALKYHPDKALSNCKFSSALTPSAVSVVNASDVSPHTAQAMTHGSLECQCDHSRPEIIPGAATST